MVPRILVSAALLAPLAAIADPVGTVNFEFDSATLDAGSEAQITEIVAALNESQSYGQMVVVGYTDAVGTTAYNDGLGLRRAQAVAQALNARGVNAASIGSVSSKGERDLLVAVTGPERQNRRVTVSLSTLLAACRSYRDITITPGAINASLQSDLQSRYEEAVVTFERFAATRGSGAAFQMAGAARDDCQVAASYTLDALRKSEYAQKCLCNSARMRAALD